MPKVGDKHFPYTEEGKKAAELYKKKMASKSKNKKAKKPKRQQRRTKGAMR